MSEKLSGEIKYVNGILAVMIVFLHGRNSSQFVCTEDALYLIWDAAEDFLSKYAYGVAVPFLFLISGYLMYLDLDKTTILRKLKSRAKSLLLPFFLWNGIAMAYFWLFTLVPAISEKMSTIRPVSSARDIISGIESRFISSVAFAAPIRVDCLFYYSVGAFAASFRKDAIVKLDEKRAKGSAAPAVRLYLAGICLLGWSDAVSLNVSIFGYLLQIMGIAAWISRSWSAVLSRPAFLKGLDPLFLLQTHYLILYPLKKAVALLWKDSALAMALGYVCLPALAVLLTMWIGTAMKRSARGVYQLLVGGRSVTEIEMR